MVTDHVVSEISGGESTLLDAINHNHTEAHCREKCEQLIANISGSILGRNLSGRADAINR